MAQRLLRHLGLPHDLPRFARARDPPQRDLGFGDDPADDPADVDAPPISDPEHDLDPARDTAP